MAKFSDYQLTGTTNTIFPMGYGSMIEMPEDDAAIVHLAKNGGSFHLIFGGEIEVVADLEDAWVRLVALLLDAGSSNVAPPKRTPKRSHR